MSTHLRVLSEGYPMNTNGSWEDFQKPLLPCALGESSLSVGKVNLFKTRVALEN